ncbi:hypothetical protein [Kocuria palustris]|uniref:hypothetical protein n=1 Tax=Kocuria palustris TaxID=71999 RepID=UPI0016429577|nr:hypothetical protein [Kocuria palustris]
MPSNGRLDLGSSAEESAEIQRLHAEKKCLREINAILCRASIAFAGLLDTSNG